MYTSCYICVCATDTDNDVSAGIRDQRVWSIKECARQFKAAIDVLKVELKKQGGGMLVWDKVSTRETPITVI